MQNLPSPICPRCQREVQPWALVRCPICGGAVCHRCAYPAYGRLFCSFRCGEYFFHGEADEGEDEERRG